MSKRKSPEGSMKYVKLGDTGPLVSELCLGTMTWGSQMTDEKLAHELIDQYVAAGGNFVDTAEIYPVPSKEGVVGTSEEIIGRWCKATGKRADVVIATKVMGPCPRDFVVMNRSEPKATEAKMPNHSREDILAACAASLRRLQTTYIDILYLHWPSRPVPLFGNSLYKASMKDTHPFLGNPYTTIEWETILSTLKELMDSGKIRHWAISNETSFGVCTIAAKCKKLNIPKPVCIQNDHSLTDRRFETELAESCAPWNHNISGVPYGILAGGTLSGKYLNGAQPAKARHVWDPKFQARYHFPRTMAACAKYVEVAKTAKLLPAVMAMAWAKQCFFNQSVIIGANNKQQMEEILSISNVTLSDETLKAIDGIHFEDKNPNVMG